MKKEDKKALESVKDMFADVTIEDIDEQKITIYGVAMLDVIRVLNLVEEQQKEIEDLENGDLTTVYMSGFYDGEKKWKDKIKAKKEYYKSYENLEIYEHYNYGEIVQVLDELYNEKEGNKND